MSTNGANGTVKDVASMTGPEFKAEMSRRRDAGLGIHADDVPFQMNRQIKALGAVWCKYNKEWLFPSVKALREACDLVGIECDAFEDESASAGEAPEPSEGETVEALRAELAALRADHERVCRVARERDEDAARSLRAAQDERNALAAKLDARPAHGLDEKVMERVAQAAGIAAAKATLDALKALAAKPDAEEEAARIASMSHAGGEAVRPIELDAAPAPLVVASDETTMPEDVADPDAGSPSGASHVTGTCRKCGKFGLVRTHVRLHEGCEMPAPKAPETPKAAPVAPPAPAPSTGGASAIMARLAARKGKGAK